MEQKRLNRRDAMRTLAAAGLGVASVPLWVETLSALAREQAPHAHAAMPPAAPPATSWVPKVLSPHQDQTVTALCELIIPQTDTPGAKAAQVNRFIDAVLKEASAADRASFLKGLTWIDGRSTALFGKDVISSTPDQQTALLTRLSSEESGAAEDQAGRDFFRALKSMTITGYYSTEIGLRKELGDDGQLVLAEFKGCTHPEHQIRD